MTSRRSPFALSALLRLLLLVTAAAAPAMEGLGSGTLEGDRAARYIAGVLPRAGLRPAGDAGPFRP